MGLGLHICSLADIGLHRYAMDDLDVHVAGWDWMWLAFAAVADIASWSGGGYSNRYRMGYA